jgi:hypothetical protein
MAEVGCLKDGCFQNLQVDGKLLLAHPDGDTGSHEITGGIPVSGALTVAGVTTLSGPGSTGPAAGIGITAGTGTVYASSVTNIGGIWHTRILIDLTGLKGFATGDIIGKDGGGNCHIGKTTVALNGTILGGKLTCLETPAGSGGAVGAPDIDLYFADEDDMNPDEAISGATAGTVMLNSGGLAAGSVKDLLPPTTGKFLYLVSGTATNEVYAAGKILIEFFGYDAA